MNRILVFCGSPRRGGNTDLLADAFVSGARAKGAHVEKIRLIELKYSPCIECGGCDETGICILDDDLTKIYHEIEMADVVTLASPMFFYNITSGSQALVERAQAFWIRQYVLQLGKIGGKTRHGVFLSAGATKGKLLFDGSLRVMRYFFDAIGGRLKAALLIRGAEKKGDVKNISGALDRAERLGSCAASSGDYSRVKGIWLPGG